MPSDANLQSRLVKAFQSSVGLAYPDSAYERFLFPTDRDPWRHAAAKDMWSCALEIRAACHAAGVTEPEASVPYEQHIGAIGALVGNMLMRAGAWHDLSTTAAIEEWWDAPGIPFNQPFDVGWGFVIGGSSPGDKTTYGGVEHYFAAVELSASGSSLSDYVITSVDGGQVDAHGNKCIKSRRRILEKMGDGSIWARDIDGVHSPQQPGTGRRVRAVFALPFLPSKDPGETVSADPLDPTWTGAGS